jgi:hypothetical protein
MKTLSDRFAELPIVTVPGALGEPRRVVAVDVALDFAMREVFANVIDLRTGRSGAGESVPFPEAQSGDFQLGLEVWRAFQSAPRNVNPLVAMGALARGAGLYQLQRERGEVQYRLRQVELLRSELESEKKLLPAVPPPTIKAKPKKKRKST